MKGSGLSTDTPLPSWVGGRAPCLWVPSGAPAPPAPHRPCPPLPTWTLPIFRQDTRLLGGSARPFLLPPLTQGPQFLLPRTRSSGSLPPTPKDPLCCPTSRAESSFPKTPAPWLPSPPLGDASLCISQVNLGDSPIPRDPRTRPDTSAHTGWAPPCVPSPLPRLLPPDCRESPGLSFPWKPNPPHRSRRPGGSLPGPSYPGFPFQGLADPSMGVGKGPSSARGRGLEGGNCRRGRGSARGSRSEEGRPAPQGCEGTG